MEDFERKILEKEKWFESLKMQEYSDLHKLVSDKEKQVFSLQEQLSTTYQDLQGEVEAVSRQLKEAQNETLVKERMLKSQQRAHDEQTKLHTDHIDKLKGIIASKTDMNTQLDLQNQ